MVTVDLERLCDTCVHHPCEGVIGVSWKASANSYEIRCDGYKQKNYEKICPTCMHGRQEGASLFYFSPYWYSCCSPVPFVMTHDNGMVYCKSWREKLELKPCPMCGGAAVVNHKYDGGDNYGVSCTKRGNAFCPGKMEVADSAEEAARMWNERP